MASVPLDRAANLARIDARLAAISGQTDLAVMPECADVGYTPEAEGWLEAAQPVPGPGTEALCEMAERHGIALVCGVLEADALAAGLYYSTAVVIDKSGELIGRYRKSHLYPKEHLWLRAGSELPLFELDGVRVGIAICFEAAISPIFTELAVRGAQLVVNPSAVPVGFDHLQDLRTPARAQDNQIFTAAANRAGAEGEISYCGGSQICGPRGQLLAKAGDGPEETIIAEIDTAEILPERLREPVFRALRPELYRVSMDRQKTP
jgi:predicted amidohydrolase